MGIRIRPGDAKDKGHIINNMHITKREIEALSLLAMGMENEEIAKKLCVGVNTIRNHIYNICQKLGAKHRAHAVVLAIQNNIIHVTDKDSMEWIELPDMGYLYCIGCGRTYKYGTWRIEPGEKVIINHVECETPEERYCPYPECDMWTDLAVDWNEVRLQHPEYPEIPEHGVKYDYEWHIPEPPSEKDVCPEIKFLS